jgi:hypothetical protein
MLNGRCEIVQLCTFRTPLYEAREDGMTFSPCMHVQQILYSSLNLRQLR